jgi:urease accessory protein
MLVADRYVGHRTDEAVAGRLVDADPHRVVLTDTERRRSRVRTATEGGADLGIVVARDLADGDVLATEDGDLVIVALADVEALVLDFADADVSPTAALELGHALGNRHWDLAVRDAEALFPVTDSRERMETLVRDLLPEGVPVHYESVPPTTFDDATPDHDHGGGTDGHDHGHSHPHSDHGVRTIDGGDP